MANAECDKNIMIELLESGVEEGQDLFWALAARFARGSRWTEPHPGIILSPIEETVTEDAQVTTK